MIALGSNLNNPIQLIQQAAQVIAKLPKIQDLQLSSLYQTKPVGYLDQPDFINAVALIQTTYTAIELLHTLQSMEQQFGRQRSFANAPRTLDLDIIDFNHQTIQSEELQLPHPRAYERGFVMIPLAEIAPHYQLGSHPPAEILANKLANIDVQKITQ